MPQGVRQSPCAQVKQLLGALYLRYACHLLGQFLAGKESQGSCGLPSSLYLSLPTSLKTWKFWCFEVVMCMGTKATASEFESSRYHSFAV